MLCLCVCSMHRRKDLELLNQHAELEKEVRERLAIDGMCTCVDFIDEVCLQCRCSGGVVWDEPCRHVCCCAMAPA